MTGGVLGGGVLFANRLFITFIITIIGVLITHGTIFWRLARNFLLCFRKSYDATALIKAFYGHI